MQPPSEIAEVLAEILAMGLLRIRAISDQPRRVFVEADHLHNLPDLLTHYSLDRLEYYWHAERTCFIERSSDLDIRAFEPMWQRLAAALETEALAGQAK